MTPAERLREIFETAALKDRIAALEAALRRLADIAENVQFNDGILIMEGAIENARAVLDWSLSLSVAEEPR